MAQKEIWLLVTDITLQIQDERDHSLPKTLPIYVAPSCVLGPGVVEELAMAVPPTILFRDALRDKGMLLSLGCLTRVAASILHCGPILLSTAGTFPKPSASLAWRGYRGHLTRHWLSLTLPTW